MGGDRLHCFASEDDESSTLDNDDYSGNSSYLSSFYRDGYNLRDDDDESLCGSSALDCKGFDEVGRGIRSNPVEFDNNLRRRKIAYNEIMTSYDELWARRECLYQAKSKILSYSPGAWISNAGDKKQRNHVVPKTTTLLLIGPKGCGKSSLVNRISRVFEDDKFSSKRAQVTYNSSAEDGTFFLQEYMVPRGSTSFCLFDTRSLSEDFVDNDKMLQHWITKGVRHGELVIRDSDSPSLKMSLKCKAQQSGTPSSGIRKVNFVIFVVNGMSILKVMNSCEREDRKYMEVVAKTFSCPYLSYKDDKPVIVVTHGDLLSLVDRARVRVYLGEKLGVPPAKQIFDIPDSSDLLTELMILDMIRYSLEHADKHLPCKESREWVKSSFPVDKIKDEVAGTSILTLMFMAILLGIACVVFPVNRSHKHNISVQESAISWPSRSQIDNPPPREHYATFPSNSEANTVFSHFKNPGLHIPEPQPRSLRVSPSDDVDGQGFVYRIPETTTAGTSQFLMKDKEEEELTSAAKQKNHEAEATSSARSPSKDVTKNQQHEIVETENTSEPDLSPKSSATKSQPLRSVETPSPRSKAVGTSQQKIQSRSPEKRHPKSAVKWHKIRHLWLDD